MAPNLYKTRMTLSKQWERLQSQKAGNRNLLAPASKDKNMSLHHESQLPDISYEIKFSLPELTCLLEVSALPYWSI